ncbi:DNA polymerase III, delta subunit, C terminal domain family [Nitrosococcus oceani AFC27]|nr:DNA polymerase III, delta subunit, C terminal domain family [Nitrosococcus oceani AFC27]KFI19462.1 DNA polymerase III subunit delta' [Nitrosococcus oceani C-27]KFI22707.1 DNA polymerase III subunit delta' [Nitrosococcus oceani]GEM21305.1 DNA polymerase III subunit delta' [Nitrosococcus oceani]
MASQIAKRMPHAILLMGPEGMGKRSFASNLIQALSCEYPQKGGHGCGSCAGCRLQLAGSHPDNLTLFPREGKQTISVNQIRQLHSHLALKARQSLFKTVIIYPAEEMTLSAANSLLKILEEPPGRTVLLLITSASLRLPITIRSRCQQLFFTISKSQEVKMWLQQRLPPSMNLDAVTLLRLSGGGPLRALEYVEQNFLFYRKEFINNLFSLTQGKLDLFEMVRSCLKDNLGEPLYWISTLVEDTIRLRSGVSKRFLVNHDVANSLQLLARRASFEMLFALLKKASCNREIWKGQININPQLLLEEILIQWLICFSKVNHEHT